MKKTFSLTDDKLSLSAVTSFVFRRSEYAGVTVSKDCLDKVAASEEALRSLMEKKVPLYGVTTGFGDSCFRYIAPEHSEALQKNLVSYLLCGSGDTLSPETSRAILLIRLRSLSRGYSGVSPELIRRMETFLSEDWLPVIPREGSLGASGDLIPLAYLARALQGEGKVHHKGKIADLSELNVPPYTLKAKEGLALVNGTTAMAGLLLTNLSLTKKILRYSQLATSWLCLVLRGRTESFDVLVNEKAGNHKGQADVAAAILRYLREEHYTAGPLTGISVKDSVTTELIQDKYSLRCAPQILGPVSETIGLVGRWLEDEINTTSDNPLIGADGEVGVGGNFYGGYLGQGSDYLKISIAHIADMLDRQLALVIDEKYNRGLPPNLADWNHLPENERSLHHGLKGLHQAMSALTSEILAKAIPNGLFSRSTESHNQDKVSLGMSSAVQCGDMLEQMLTCVSLHLICLAQALDLRKITLKGEEATKLYALVRAHVPFVTGDRALDGAIIALRKALKESPDGD